MSWIKKIWMLIPIILLLSCEKPQKGLDSLFPGAGFEKGWSWYGKPKHYDPQTLYQYINGEAELYLSYHFKELATLTYFWGHVDEVFFVVDIYEMASHLDAFGLYSNYRHPAYNYEKIGTESIVSDYGIRFYQGRYVVEFKAGDNSDKIKHAMRSVARLMTDRINEPDVHPDIIYLLPNDGIVDKTRRYFSRGMLNQSFLPGGLEARYHMDGEDATGFIVIFDHYQDALNGLKELENFYRETDGKIDGLKNFGDNGFAVETSYSGWIFFSIYDRYILGVHNFKHKKTGGHLLEKILENLKTSEIS